MVCLIKVLWAAALSYMHSTAWSLFADPPPPFKEKFLNETIQVEIYTYVMDKHFAIVRLIAIQKGIV